MMVGGAGVAGVGSHVGHIVREVLVGEAGEGNVLHLDAEVLHS